MNTLPVRLTLAGLFAGLLGLAAAWATGPVPGVNINLGQVPGGVIATAAADDQGRVTFYDLPPGTYTVSIADPSKLKAAAVLSIVVAGARPILSDPVPVPPAGAKGRMAGGGAALALIIPVDRTPGAKSYNSTRSNISQKPGLAPPGANPKTVITVTVTSVTSEVTKGR
jgi:hypothetical protein